MLINILPAAFGRLCVETLRAFLQLIVKSQPPSGGCVLKHVERRTAFQVWNPAAFGRLCVETTFCHNAPPKKKPAAFGRLCVETTVLRGLCPHTPPAAFGRLCVETAPCRASRLGNGKPAAFGRLCVETTLFKNN